MIIRFSGQCIISARALTKNEQEGNDWASFRSPIAVAVGNGILVYAGSPPLGSTPGMLACARRSEDGTMVFSPLCPGQLVREPVWGPEPAPEDVRAALGWPAGLGLRVGSIYLVPCADEGMAVPGIFLAITSDGEIVIIDA